MKSPRMLWMILFLVPAMAMPQPTEADSFRNARAIVSRWNSLPSSSRDIVISSSILRSLERSIPEQASVGLALSIALEDVTTISLPLQDAFTSALVSLAHHPAGIRDPMHGTVISNGELVAWQGLRYLHPSNSKVREACELICERRDSYGFGIRTDCQELLARGGHDASLRKVGVAADDAITTSVRLISIVQLSSPTLEELEFVRKHLAGQDRGVRGMAYSEAIKKSQLNPVFADVILDVAAADPEHGDLPIAFLAGQPEPVIGKLGPKFRKLFLDQRHSEKGRASALRALANLKQDVPPADLVSFFCFAAEERSQAIALETAKKLNLYFDDASKKIMRSKALSPEVLKRF